MFKSQISTAAKGAAGAATPINGNEISLLNCQYLILPPACGTTLTYNMPHVALTLESWALRRAEVSTAPEVLEEPAELQILHMSHASPEAQEKPSV